MESADIRAELNCSICLNLYRDPVMLRCGHNFCQGCIGSVLDSQEQSGFYTCPECRKRFTVRPSLQKNRKLFNIVEHFLCTRTEVEISGLVCTYCDSPVPAVKTCLQCETSLCDIHLRKHNRSVEHLLTEPTACLTNKKCSVHKKLLEYYCIQDTACICVSCCAFGEHKGHSVELLNEASEKKRMELRDVLKKLTSQRDDTEKRLEILQEHLREVQDKAASTAEEVCALLGGIREKLDVLEKQVLNEITRQEQQISLRTTDLIQKLEIKKEDLSRKILHNEELCNNTDPLNFLQGLATGSDALCDPDAGDTEDQKSDGKMVPPVGDLDQALISVTLYTVLADIVTDVKTKRGLCGQQFADILLDISTAGVYVAVSGDLKTASGSELDQCRPKTPKRFTDCAQILSTSSFSSGKHYWEVETSTSGDWDVGMAYQSIERVGDQSSIGENKKSWCLRVDNNDHLVVHDSKQKLLHPKPSYQRLGIFLDYEAGRLSFYQLLEPIRLLHTFSTTFTEPLHAAFWISYNGWVRIRN
ncbi:E3 ubiquitin/ISG15 ligase TRIM25-like [Rhinophrynus dorsalis]